MKKINQFLIIIISFIAIDSIVLNFNQHQSFKKLQQLYSEYEQLVSTHKAYLMRYKQQYNLLNIHHRATNDLKMTMPKKSYEL